MNTLIIRTRSLARRLGLLRFIHRVRPSRHYERHFHRALQSAIKEGDVVWDIGANVGLYTELFCKWVGPTGRVFAFEPFPVSLQQIRERLPDCPWLHLEGIALGENDGQGQLVLGDSSTTNHLETNGAIPASNTIEVPVCRGDSLAKRFGQIPNVIKIDVEGFEEEVLAGLGHILSSAELRSILMEVHFQTLEKRGRATAPVRIEKSLRNEGFRIKWLDASHLKAERLPRMIA